MVDQEKNCPYCKKSGKLDKWYNHYTDEENEEDCPACEGTGVCEDQLMLDHAEANLEPEIDELILAGDESQQQSDELPF